MKLHEAVAKSVSDAGVSVMFGLMGDANMLIVTDFMRHHDGRFVGSAHESVGVSAADGYSRVSGRLGVVSVTHGPALTNTVTPLVEAVKSQSQVLLLTGDTPHLRAHLQTVDIRALAALTGAGYEQVFSPKTVFDDIARALWRISNEHRPVVLDVPADLLLADVTAEPRAFLPPNAVVAGPSPDALDHALGLIASATRPLVLAGRGAVIAGARHALVELADLIGAPLATTVGAKDLFRGHAFDLGICGTLSTEVTTEAVGTADCVIAFGAGLNQYTSALGSLFAGKRIVHCDVNPSRMGAFTRVDAAVIGDARLSAEAMLEGLQESGVEVGTSAFRSAGLANTLAKASPRDEFVDSSTADTIDVRAAMVRLDELLPDRRTLVTDTGRYMLAPWKYLHVDDPRCFVSTVAFGSIGLGIGSAIGAAVARPDELTVLVAGDGGFMQHIGDLSTAARTGHRMLVVVANDHAYGAEYRKLKEYGVDPAFSFNEWPDFASVARAMGGDGMTVRTLAELDDVARRLGETNLLLVDLKLDPSIEPSG